jgi:hypothetical protein
MDLDQIADLCAGSLLGLIVSHKDKHFISDLAGQCFAQMLDSVSVTVASAILVAEHRRKHDDARAHVALAMVKLAGRMTDFSHVLKPLVTLMKDRNPNVRKSARLAVGTVRSRARNFAQMVDTFENEEDRSALLEAF